MTFYIYINGGLYDIITVTDNGFSLEQHKAILSGRYNQLNNIEVVEA
jgi:hypothetical protein